MLQNENITKNCETPKFSVLNESFINNSNFLLVKDDNKLELNRSFSVDYIDTSDKIIYVKFMRNKKKKKIKKENKTELCKKNILLSPINNLYEKQLNYVTSLSKIKKDFSTLNAKFDYIYKLLLNKNLKNNWKNQFELICEKMNLNLEDIKYNLNFKTNNPIQSYLFTIDKFWIILIQYIGTQKNLKNFSFEKFILILKISNKYVKSLSIIIDMIFLIPESIINKITKTEMLAFCNKESVIFSKKNEMNLTKKDIIKKIFSSKYTSKFFISLTNFSYICPKYCSSLNATKSKKQYDKSSKVLLDNNNHKTQIQQNTKHILNKLIEGIKIE